MKIKYNKIFLFAISAGCLVAGSYFHITHPDQSADGYITIAIFAGVAGLMCDS